MPDTLARKLVEHIGTVLLGNPKAIERTIVTLFAGGHLLIEDRPGVGKTLLARALARSLDLPFQRLQCTADLLPADIIGAQIYDQASGDIRFRQGPVFTSVLVADELNRTPPRTQSALLECMAEGRVTVDRSTVDLPTPFFVVATQNPVRSAGTYPLPESQLDRFLMRIELGYPEADDEMRIVAREDGHRALEGFEAVADGDTLRRAQAAVSEVRMQADLVAYVVALAQRTREIPEVKAGISPRGAQALHRAARAQAVMAGRDYVVPDDLRDLVQPVFRHRLCADGGDDAAMAILSELLHSVPCPD